MTFNGKEYDKNWLSHRELMKGAIIDFKMVASPNLTRGVEEKDYPYSFSKEKK
jgi:putative alpha-1,2-mannosidase